VLSQGKILAILSTSIW